MTTDPQRHAVIDIGSNSVKLLVVDVHKNHVQPRFESSLTTRLAEGLSHQPQLSSQAVQRTFEAIEKFHEKAKNLGAKDIRAFGTSALRSCENPQALLNLLEKKLQLSTRILSGQEEATLIFQGVLSDPLIPQASPLLVMDLGGGSVEFISNQSLSKNKPLTQASLDIGCVRIKEKFFTHYPISPASQKNLKTFLETQLSPHSFLQLSHTVVLTGGAITCLLPWLKVSSQKSHSHFPTILLKQFTETLLSLTLPDLLSHPFLPQDRADLMPAGCLILTQTLNFMKTDSFFVSKRNLRYGLVSYK
ncbi:MAG: hypothetical protein K1X66_00525 [Verrucomicrobiae bacterium]|nr:hypothetical protein [Verrucomicrobiae bacterium]